MAKQSYTKDQLLEKRMRARRFQDDVRLYSADLSEDKQALEAAMQFVAALQALIDWCNMKLGELVRE